MRSTILTIFPHPSDRVDRTSDCVSRKRPALSAAAGPQPTETRGAVAHGSPEALPSIESLLLQRLLAEVEARQITRAQPTYVIEQQTASRHTTLIRTLWSLLWALSVILCIFVVKYIDSQTIAPRSDAGQSRAIESLTASLGGQQKELSAMVDALQGLAGTIALDSTRAAAIPDILNRLTTEFQ